MVRRHAYITLMRLRRQQPCTHPRPTGESLPFLSRGHYCLRRRHVCVRASNATLLCASTTTTTVSSSAPTSTTVVSRTTTAKDGATSRRLLGRAWWPRKCISATTIGIEGDVDSPATISHEDFAALSPEQAGLDSPSKEIGGGREEVCQSWEKRSQVDEENGAETGRPGEGSRVVVGMSGGVDSSVAAMLLQQQGYRVTGVFMRNWDGQDETGSDVCTADADLEDAQMVGACLGIPIETVDFSREYWHEVFAPSVEEFERCRTPNMDVACNRFIKFDAFRDHALDSMGADFVATGHYARTRPGPGGDWDSPLLVQAVDANKDQTYFLCAVPSSCLVKVLFPLGGLTKPEVRELAAKACLPVAKKRESMGVCFVGKRRSWAEFISQYLRPKPGNFVCVDTGDVVGKHDGVQLYTVGQKSHLSGMSEKYFVAALDAETNSVIVAKGASHPSLFSWGLSSRASEFHWVAGVPPRELLVLRSPSTLSLSSAVCSGVDGGVGDARMPAVDSVEGLRDTQGGASTAGAAAAAGCASGGDDDDADDDDDSGREARRGLLRCTYRCRHRQELLPCTVELRDGHTNSRRRRIGDSAVNTEKVEAEARGEEQGGKRKTQALVTLRFDEPAKAIAPGQVVALYRDGVCLGGGSILRAEGALLSGKKTPLMGFVGDNGSVFPLTDRRRTAS